MPIDWSQMSLGGFACSCGNDTQPLAAHPIMCFANLCAVLRWQAQTLELLLAGNDMVGRARTGCGKTLAFVLPIVEKLAASVDANGRRSFGRQPSVIVLLPTRELAKQVCARPLPAHLSSHRLSSCARPYPSTSPHTISHRALHLMAPLVVCSVSLPTPHSFRFSLAGPCRL